MGSLAKDIGVRLRLLRTMLGLSRDKMAALADVSKASLSYWEHGRVSPLKPRSMRKLIEVFKNQELIVSEKWFMEGTGEPPYFLGKNKSVEGILLSQSLKAHKTVASNNTKFSLDENIKIFVDLNSNLSREIIDFSKLNNSIVLKVSDSNFSPFYEKGDYIGAIKQKSLELDGKKIIAYGKTDYSLVLIEKNKDDQLIYFSSISDYKNKIFEPIELDNFGYIVRLWRQII